MDFNLDKTDAVTQHSDNSVSPGSDPSGDWGKTYRSGAFDPTKHISSSEMHDATSARARAVKNGGTGDAEPV